jgi:hypothetical protein
MALDIRDPVARVQFIPAAVEVLGDQAELDDQDAGWRAVSSLPMITRASEPPMKWRRSKLFDALVIWLSLSL